MEKTGIISSMELVKQFIENEEKWKNNPAPRIGKVTYDKLNGQLLLDTGMPNYIYDIDLDRCKTNAQILHWIMHIVVGKNWATPELTKDLILMFEKVAYNWDDQ